MLCAASSLTASLVVQSSGLQRPALLPPQPIRHLSVRMETGGPNDDECYLFDCSREPPPLDAETPDEPSAPPADDTTDEKLVPDRDSGVPEPEPDAVLP